MVTGSASGSFIHIGSDTMLEGLARLVHESIVVALSVAASEPFAPITFRTRRLHDHEGTTPVAHGRFASNASGFVHLYVAPDWHDSIRRIGGIAVGGRPVIAVNDWGADGPPHGS